MLLFMADYTSDATDWLDDIVSSTIRRFSSIAACGESLDACAKEL